MFAVEKYSIGAIPRRHAIYDIDQAVSGRLGPTRVSGNAQPAAFNRQVAMYLARALGGWSTTKIGKFYNGRHHTTVLHAVRRIESLRATSVEVDDLLRTLAEEIQSRPTRGADSRVRTVPESVGHRRMCTMPEELVEALADRLMSRLKSIVDEAVAVQILQR
jgi:hypothetical protein